MQAHSPKMHNWVALDGNVQKQIQQDKMHQNTVIYEKHPAKVSFPSLLPAREQDPNMDEMQIWLKEDKKLQRYISSWTNILKWQTEQLQ